MSFHLEIPSPAVFSFIRLTSHHLHLLCAFPQLYFSRPPVSLEGFYPGWPPFLSVRFLRLPPCTSSSFRSLRRGEKPAYAQIEYSLSWHLEICIDAFVPVNELPSCSFVSAAPMHQMLRLVSGDPVSFTCPKSKHALSAYPTWVPA